MPFPLDHYIEASHVDYKERLEEKKPRSWLKSVSAFANTEGGHLIFGVKNEPREVVGVENPQAVVSRLTELIKVRIDPTPRYRVREVEIEGKSCVDLEVQDGRRIHIIMPLTVPIRPMCGMATSPKKPLHGN